jgi:hypothetical protein
MFNPRPVRVIEMEETAPDFWERKASNHV